MLLRISSKSIFRVMLEPLCGGTEFAVYRGRQRGGPKPVLAVALVAEQSTTHP